MEVVLGGLLGVGLHVRESGLGLVVWAVVVA